MFLAPILPPRWAVLVRVQNSKLTELSCTKFKFSSFFRNHNLIDSTPLTIFRLAQNATDLENIIRTPQLAAEDPSSIQKAITGAI